MVLLFLGYLLIKLNKNTCDEQDRDFSGSTESRRVV
jgi:hypothetical protein